MCLLDWPLPFLLSFISALPSPLLFSSSENLRRHESESTVMTHVYICNLMMHSYEKSLESCYQWLNSPLWFLELLKNFLKKKPHWTKKNTEDCWVVYLNHCSLHIVLNKIQLHFRACSCVLCATLFQLLSMRDRIFLLFFFLLGKKVHRVILHYNFRNIVN